MQSSPISTANQTGGTGGNSKLVHAAREFEALLLNDLLGPVEKTFSSVPGEENSAGSGNYQYLGTQALASSLAASGGLGIAGLIVHNVMKNK